MSKESSSQNFLFNYAVPLKNPGVGGGRCLVFPLPHEPKLKYVYEPAVSPVLFRF
jgi:hypothetical protein